MAEQFPGDLTPLATGTFFEQPVQPPSTSALSKVGDLTIGGGNLTGTPSFLQSEFTQFAEERVQRTSSVAIAIEDPVGGSKPSQAQLPVQQQQPEMFAAKPFNAMAIGEQSSTSLSNFTRLEPTSRIAEFDPLSQISDMNMQFANEPFRTSPNSELRPIADVKPDTRSDKNERLATTKKTTEGVLEWDLDATYHLNAWIVPRNVETALRKCKPGQRDPSFTYTPPTVVQEHMQTDVIRELLISATQQTAVELDVNTLPMLPDENNVSQDFSGVRVLIERECYRAAANLCARLLIQAGHAADKQKAAAAPPKSASRGAATAQTNTNAALSAYTATLWHVRSCLLMKLRQYNILEAEFATFGSVGLTFDRPDFQFEFYSPSKNDATQNDAFRELVLNGCSVIPFGLRVLFAELPQFLGRPLDSLDRLYALLSVCRRVLVNLDGGKSECGTGKFQSSLSTMMKSDDNERPVALGPASFSARSRTERNWTSLAHQTWTERERTLVLRIANAQFSMKDYVACVQTLETLLRSVSQATFLQNCSLPTYANDQPDALRRKLLLLLLRTHLHAGDIDSADYYFGRIVAELNEDEKQRSLVLFNKALLFAARGDYEDARQYFKDALVASAGQGAASSANAPGYTPPLGSLGRPEEDPRAGALLNNVAVCSLYTGKLRDAIELLEQLVRNEPNTYLHEAVLFNLSTLYELESTRAPIKKRALLEQVARVRGDAFNAACLKIQN